MRSTGCLLTIYLMQACHMCLFNLIDLLKFRTPLFQTTDRNSILRRAYLQLYFLFSHLLTLFNVIIHMSVVLLSNKMLAKDFFEFTYNEYVQRVINEVKKEKFLRYEKKCCQI